MDWIPIPGQDGEYSVSRDGKVKSEARTVMRSNGVPQKVRERTLKPSLNKAGYPVVVLKGRKMHLVHTLVMLAYVGPRPEGADICHNNGNPADNRLENLRYDTRSANQLDKQLHGTEYNRNKERCPRGHLLVSENIVPAAARDGHRACYSCRQAYIKLYRRGGRDTPPEEWEWKELSDMKYKEKGIEPDFQKGND